jgi:hypothetical protein
MAEVLDSLDDARKKARAAVIKAEQATEAANKAKAKLEDMKKNPDGVDPETLAAAEKEAQEADKQAAKSTRKAAKAEAKAETAAREAESSGVLPEGDKEEK